MPSLLGLISLDHDSGLLVVYKSLKKDKQEDWYEKSTSRPGFLKVMGKDWHGHSLAFWPKKRSTQSDGSRKAPVVGSEDPKAPSKKQRTEKRTPGLRYAANALH